VEPASSWSDAPRTRFSALNLINSRISSKRTCSPPATGKPAMRDVRLGPWHRHEAEAVLPR